jgi:flagellar L-ring protein precursor FlgH
VTKRLVFGAALVLSAAPRKNVESPIDRLARESGQVSPAGASSGSIWSPSAQFGELASDLRPRRVHDVVTVVVRDRASALARGTSTSARSSEAKGSVTSIFGAPPGGNRLPNMLGMSSSANLDGEGETSRETVLNTTLSARVTHVLPNGLIVIEGQKSVRVNSEMQTVTVRGLLRPLDVSARNTVYSDQIAELEVAVNGKGIVADAVRRPNILYRILLGILPF